MNDGLGRSLFFERGFTSRSSRLAGRLLRIAATLVVLLSAGAVFAQDVRDEPPPATPAPPLKRSENLVVTATRSERSVEDVPVSVTVVPRKEIENAPSRTLDDVLRTVVGLNLPFGSSNVIQPTTNHVSMRGLGGDRALVLLDGVPLNNPVSGFVEWNKAPLGTVEKVEIVRGAASSLFGNYAMGGVVNIFTRPLEPGRVDADVSYGAFNTRRLSTSVTESLGAGLSAGLFADYEKTDGYDRTLPADRGALDIASGSRSLNLMAKLEARADSGLEAFLKGNLFDQAMGQGTPLANNNRRTYDVAGGGKVSLGSSEVSVSAFCQDSKYGIDNPLFAPGKGRDAEYLSNHGERPGHDIGGSLQWSMPMTGLLTFVTAGLDVRRVGSHDSTINFNISGQQTGTRTSQGHQTFAGLFAEASFLRAPRLEVLVSARLDVWKNAGGQEETTPGGLTTYEDKSTTRLDPRLSLRYGLDDVVALRGAVYRAFHAPSLSDLYRSSANRTLQIVANPALGPETLVGGDLGVDVAAGRFRGQLNVFLSQVDGLVARQTLASSPIMVVQPHNLGSARSRGVEVMGALALGKALSLNAGYAFTDSVVTDNPADQSLVGNQVPGVPRHVGSLALNGTLPSGLSVTLRGRALSREFGDDANQLATDKLVILDLFVSCPLTRALEILASGENLLDRQYVADVNVGRRLGQPLAVFIGLRLRQPLSRAPRPSARF